MEAYWIPRLPLEALEMHARNFLHMSLKHTQDHEDALNGVKEDLRQEIVHNALVLGEAVEDATAGIGVKEAEGRPEDVVSHLLIHQRRRTAKGSCTSALLTC